MKKPTLNLSPASHPNAYAGTLSGLITGVLLYEAKKRLGFELDGSEQSYLSVGVAGLVLLAGRKLGGGK